MTRLILPIALILTALAMPKAWAFDSNLPDDKLTPGVTRQVDRNTLCSTSTKLVRHTSSTIKQAVYKEYGIRPKHALTCSGVGHSCYEIDHRIALEDGGADDIKNLWPQPYDGVWNAHMKDKLENYVHKQICFGKMTVQQGQAVFLGNWIEYYQSVFYH